MFGLNPPVPPLRPVGSAKARECHGESSASAPGCGEMSAQSRGGNPKTSAGPPSSGSLGRRGEAVRGMAGML